MQKLFQRIRWWSLFSLVAILLISCRQEITRIHSPELLTTIFLVRHAEKDTLKKSQPLTEQGHRRAKTLANMLKNSGITTIYTTQYLRTQQTVEPLCAMLSKQHHIQPVGDNIDDHVKELTKTILSNHRGETVLVSSHSNVIPMIIRSFGIDTTFTISDGDYGNLYIITKSSLVSARLVHMDFEIVP